MDIKTASPIPAPRHQPRLIKEASLLTATGLLGLHFEPGTLLFVSPSLRGTTPTVALDNPPEKATAKESEGKEPPKPATFEDVLKIAKITGTGGVGGAFSGYGLKLFKLSRSTTKPELYGLFTNYNMTPQAADTMADKVLEICNSTLGKACFLGVAGGGLAFSILRLTRPGWSLKRLFLISGILAVVITILYLVLARLNVTT